MTETDSSERKLVLEMLADGKINVDDAQRLLDKLQEVEGRQQNGDGVGAGSGPPPRAKHLRIVIAGGEEDVNLRIPLGLVRAGLAIDSFLPKWAQGGIFVGSSLTDLQALDKDYLRENLDDLDMTFDSEDGESVHIFSE